MANLLKFYRGAASVVAQAPVGAIWFDTENDVIKVRIAENGVDADWEVYGTSPAELSALAERVLTLEGAMEIVNGADTVEGSFRKAIKDAIAAEAELREEGDTALKDRLDIVQGEANVDGSIKKAVADAKAELLGDAAEEYNTLGKLEDKIQAILAASVSVAEKAEGHVTVSKATNETTGAVVYTIAENDIASAEALDDEIERATAAEEALADRLDVIEGEGEGSVKKALADAKAYTDEAKAAVIGDATEAGNTLGKLEDRIESIVANEKTYSVAKMTAEEVAALGNANVKEAYKLIDEDKAAVGDPILVYKDSSLKSAAMGTGDDAQKLILTYVLADGSESVVPVDLSAFYAESETGNGLQVVDHVISVKVDATSEAFLTVGADGVKLAGVQDAINTAIANLDAEVASTDGAKVTVKVTEVDGKITAVNVTESDIASAAALATLDAEVQEHEQVVAGALNDLNSRLTTAEGSVADHETRLTTAEDEIDALQAAVDGMDVGVTKVTGDTTNTFVKVSATPETGDVALGVQVAVQDGATAGTKLATDTYVAEQSAAAESNAKTYADNLMSWVVFE